MTERVAALPSIGVRAWRSLRTTRQRVEAGVAFTAAVACVVAAGIQVGPALAEPKIEGVAVPAEVLPAIVVGVTSCPDLTGPRLAAQLMAASEFNTAARSATGQGLAGLDDEGWKKWAPWSGAQRADVLANVLALAHRTCESVGQARSFGVEGDLWEAAVAAEESGLTAVVQAKRVPDAARAHVDTVTGYANWYADQPQFTGEQAEPESSGAPGVNGETIPEEYVGLVVEAGKICPAASAPRIAAQLMALSAFNPNLRGHNGGMGIAQFTPEMWRLYRPSANASVWDPKAAIPAMGSAVCSLRNQLSGLHLEDDGQAGDPGVLALAAYQWGMTAVRAEGGVPRNAFVAQLPDMVDSLAPVYEKDGRLIPVTPSPSAAPTTAGPSSSSSPSPSAPGTPSPSPSGAAPSSPAPSAPASSPAAPAWDPKASWVIKNVYSGRVIDVPGYQETTAGGTTMHLWDRADGDRDQFWHVVAAPEAGWFFIKNAWNNKVLGIRDGSTANHAELVMQDEAATVPTQHWQLKDLGEGRYHIINRKSGKALDLNGDDCCGGNGTPIQQYDLQDFAVDQRWTLSK
ncbi:hypothetical protein J2S43_004606 [Catenuloplanes nepalensis]|uniref:Ricin B lectin domain-containing protein n=1 Tax=Catenuloplanes nepalensis TaxID=587533 RepID=A0ABT9MXC6_9ACTN|nr:RICIN domain-containing protein [Catenuloplanes nepalensis]MDP9796094.1 hypothetical protein [Catenuloplanes nepalensis]